MAEPVKAVGEPFEPNTTCAPAAAPRPSSRRVLSPGKAGVAGRAPSETATLICAVSVAVTLGIAFGLWLNVRLAAAAASEIPPAPAHLMPAVSAETEPRPADDSDASSPAAAAKPSHGSDGPEGVAEGPRTDPGGTTNEGGVGKRGTGAAAGEASRLSKDAEDSGRAPEVKKRAVAGQGRAAPCALYASANSLTIRGGGAASLVLGGPGESGRVAVNTPDWSDIAVFFEGRTGGNGWVRYSVRSVSKRPGVYAVRFKTPCGSQTIPVTVTRP